MSLLNNKCFFFTLLNIKVNTTPSSANLIEDIRKSVVLLSKETNFFYIKKVLFSNQSKRNLLSFKDNCYNGYHIETNRKIKIEYFYILYYLK